MIELSEIIIYLAIVASISAVALYVFFKSLNPCTAVFLRKQGDTYVKVSQKKFNYKTEKISLHGKTFYVDLKKIAYLNPTKPILFFDYDNGNVLTFTEVKNPLSSDELDVFVSKQIIKQLASSVSPLTINWMLMIIMVVLGVFIGIVVAPYLPSPATSPPPTPPPVNSTYVPLTPTGG